MSNLYTVQALLLAMTCTRALGVTTAPTPTPAPPVLAPLILPRPDVMVELNATLVADDAITFDCAQTYSDDFSNSHQDVASRVNDAIGRSELCAGSNSLALAGDVNFVTLGNTGRIAFKTYVFPDAQTTIRDNELCAYEVELFLMQMNNWQQPIVPGYGCPPTAFVPSRFDFVQSSWNCIN